ncbi:MAG: cellulose biosynthesis protein BcsS [Hyphomicrobium sp.]
MLWREVFAGADATADGWLVFSGATVAPFGHIHDQGFRMRVTSGYGAYQYSGIRCLTKKRCLQGHPGTRLALTKYQAETSFTDLVAGYLWRFDPLIVKILAGGSIIGHNIAPFDEENLAIGFDWGPKVGVELWLNMGDDMWASLDASWTGAHEAFGVRSRIGYRLWPHLSVGLEARLNLDRQGACDLDWDTSDACQVQFADQIDDNEFDLLDFGRGGLFARYEWTGGEISLSGGISGSSIGRADLDDPDPYGMIAWIMQY